MRANSYDLVALGWTAERSHHFRPFHEQGLVPARVGAQHRGAYVLYSASGEHWAEPSGRLLHEASGGSDLPAVGDWVAARHSPGRAAIQAVLPRSSVFSRAAFDMTRPDGYVDEQVVAANVDLVFVVTALGQDLNARRLERYLAAAWGSGAYPVIVVTKTDLFDDVGRQLAEVELVTFGVPVHPISNVTGEGVQELLPWLAGDRTVALLGSSGVGKSSLVNRLLGSDVQTVREIREDGRGRHTTTHRELFVLPGGGLVLDTPGLRVFKLWDADGGLETAFSDVEAVALGCRFRDCRHEAEPGCAVRAALAAGSLSSERFDGYRKLQGELAHVERKHDKRASAEERRRSRAIHKEHRRSERSR